MVLKNLFLRAISGLFNFGKFFEKYIFMKLKCKGFCGNNLKKKKTFSERFN